MTKGGNLPRQTRHGDDPQLSSSSVGSIDHSERAAGGMELMIEKVAFELLALRQLYGLLQTNNDSELDPIAVRLDETGRAFLKDLLDQASERLLKTYSQIITDQISMRASSSTASLLKPADSVQVSRSSPLVGPNIKCESGFQKTISNQDGITNTREVPRVLGTSSNRSGTLSRRCSVCSRSSMMQQVLSEEPKTRLQTESRTIGDDHPHKSSVCAQDPCPLPVTLGKIIQKPPRKNNTPVTISTSTKAESSDQEICPRRDIAYAIKQIEAQVLVLRHLYQFANPLEGAGRQITNPSQTELPGPRRENSKSTTKMAGRTDTRENPSWCMSQVRAPNAWTSCQSMDFVHGYHVPRTMDEVNMTPSHADYEESDGKFVQRRQLFPSQDGIHSMTSAGSSNRKLMRKKNLTGHVDIGRPASIERRGDKRMLPSKGNKSRKVGPLMPTNRNLARQMESEARSSGSRGSLSYSSSWTSSQQTSPSCTYTSEDSSRSYSGAFGRSESESEDSSSFSSYSGPSQQGNVEPPLKVFSPRRRSRSRNPGRAIGKLRKIKNKLGLIFHHHHHHHHHHHGNEEVRAHSKSKRTNVEKDVLHGPIVEKPKKQLGKRSRGGHFHALVEGLMRHVRHKKEEEKLKPPDPTGLERNRKKKKRKLHWWQMTRRRAGVKLRRSKLKLPKKRL